MAINAVGERMAGEYLAVTVTRRRLVGSPWVVQIRRRDNDRRLQRLACSTYDDARALAARVERDLASNSLDTFCHTYLIMRAAMR